MLDRLLSVREVLQNRNLNWYTGMFLLWTDDGWITFRPWQCGTSPSSPQLAIIVASFPGWKFEASSHAIKVPNIDSNPPPPHTHTYTTTFFSVTTVVTMCHYCSASVERSNYHWWSSSCGSSCSCDCYRHSDCRPCSKPSPSETLHSSGC